MKQRIVVFTILFISGILLFPYIVAGDNTAAIRGLINKFPTSVTKNDVSSTAIKIAEFGPEAVPLLIESLSHETYYVRTGVIQSLDKINDPRMIDALGEMLAKIVVPPSSAYGPENLAVEILERHGADGIRGLECAIATRDDYIKRKVTEALGRSNNPNAVPVLISVLPYHYAVVALGKLKDPKAIEALVSILPLNTAIVSLGEINDPRAITPLLREIHKKPTEVNTEFLLAGNIPSNISIEEKQNLTKNMSLLTGIKNSKNEVMKEALSELGVPLVPRLYEVAAEIPTNIDLDHQLNEFADRLISLLVSKDLKDRYIAEFVIAKIGRAIEPSIIKALSSNSNSHLRKAVAEQMGKMQGVKIENALVKALADQNPLVVAYAAHSLGELRSQSALEPLKKVAITGSLFERRGAVWAITKIGSPTEKAFLKDICNDKDEYVRRNASCGSLDGT